MVYIFQYIWFFVIFCYVYCKSEDFSMLDIKEVKCKPHLDLLASKNNSVPSFCKYMVYQKH